MSDICSVCLNKMEEDHIIKYLSCNHKLHYKCYMDIVFRDNLFIQCPICRVRNTNIDKPNVSSMRNIELICSRGVGKVNCNCKTKKGDDCKNKSRLLNYGMCYHHNNAILKEELYPLMVRFMYMILSQRNNWRAKIHLFDIGKKLIIKYTDKDSCLDDILFKFYEYFTISEEKSIKDYGKLYDYFIIEKPPDDWLNHCIEKHVFI